MTYIASQTTTINNPILLQQIDDVLPQTQCGLCGHPGCLPYAASMVDGEEANKCVPGGQPVADHLARLLGRLQLPAAPSRWPIAQDGRPARVKAVVREAECIGCTKCITACPVDAIIGTGKMMHSIIDDLCTGCELCIPPCPVNCIDLLMLDSVPDEAEREIEQADLRQRFNARLKRDNLNQLKSNTNRKPILAVNPFLSMLPETLDNTVQASESTLRTTTTLILEQADALILMAKHRSQIKKLQRKLSTILPDHPSYILLAKELAAEQSALDNMAFLSNMAEINQYEKK